MDAPPNGMAQVYPRTPRGRPSRRGGGWRLRSGGRDPDDVVGEARERVEPDHPRRGGDEVGRGVDVVEVDAAVGAAHEVFDAPDVDRRRAREGPGLIDAPPRRAETRTLV